MPSLACGLSSLAEVVMCCCDRARTHDKRLRLFCIPPHLLCSPFFFPFLTPCSNLDPGSLRRLFSLPCHCGTCLIMFVDIIIRSRCVWVVFLYLVAHVFFCGVCDVWYTKSVSTMPARRKVRDCWIRLYHNRHPFMRVVSYALGSIRSGWVYLRVAYAYTSSCIHCYIESHRTGCAFPPM